VSHPIPAQITQLKNPATAGFFRQQFFSANSHNQEPSMPKNKVSDPITDQEMGFALLVLSGAMTDRQAAEAVGLNPDSAAYIKSKPSVHDYMIQRRAAVEQQLVQQEVGEQHRLNLDREKVLDRLWELAYLRPEITRNSITGQVKALSLIIAMQNFIPDRRAVSTANKPAAPVKAEIYKSKWLREQQAATIDPQPTPAPPVPACRGTQEDAELQPAPGPVAEATPAPVPSQPALAHRVPQADGLPPYVPLSNFVPDTRVPFSIKVNPFKHRR
jgi:hypothetical protein